MDYDLGLAITFVVAGAGAYLGSYLKKKGENLATHEDIAKLVDQVKAVTQATKQVEATISNQIWDRQKAWELKKETIFEVMRDLGKAQFSLINLHSVFALVNKSSASDVAANTIRKADAAGGWGQASFTLQQSKTLLVLVCGPKLRSAFNNVVVEMVNFVDEIFNNFTPELEAGMPLLLAKH
jgi:hypothetical protein